MHDFAVSEIDYCWVGRGLKSNWLRRQLAKSPLVAQRPTNTPVMYSMSPRGCRVDNLSVPVGPQRRADRFGELGSFFYERSWILVQDLFYRNRRLKHALNDATEAVTPRPVTQHRGRLAIALSEPTLAVVGGNDK